jgi:hypothetical protein
MERRECPVFRVTYELHSKEGEPAQRKIIVKFENKHNHPPLAHHKLTYQAKRAVHEACRASGDGGITAARLMNGTWLHMIIHSILSGYSLAPTPKMLNEGKLLTSLYPSLHNNRLVCDATATARREAYPHGTAWPGNLVPMVFLWQSLTNPKGSCKPIKRIKAKTKTSGISGRC